MNKDVAKIIKQILRDIQVEMKDEFDQNFTRQAFFSEKWARRRSPLREGRALLSGPVLRKSIHSKTTANSITFYTDVPYAGIHNEGGKIKVTRAMKGHFWKKYYEAVGAYGRKKDGSLRRDKRNTRLTTEADFYKYMALKKEGSYVTIPRRRFLGVSPEVEAAVREIVEENISEYFNRNDVKIGTK